LGKPSLENDIRQVLGGLTSVVKGIGALRTHAGMPMAEKKAIAVSIPASPASQSTRRVRSLSS
jgi:hypothetical protein